MSAGLLDWVDSPRDGAGLHEFEDPTWGLDPYPALADRVRGVSAQLREAGIDRGDVVALAATESADFAAALFGVLHAGATPLPIAAAPASARAEADRTAVGILEATSPRLIAAGGKDLGRARDLRAAAGSRSEVIELAPESLTDLAPAKPAPLALLQFTSGSSGRPRGVRVSAANLESNIAAIRRWLDWDTQAGGASWLPLQHDMGLIGMLMVAVCAQRDLWQMKPADFLAKPLRWLECFGSGKASITAAPTFGYSYVARRVDASQLEGLDFSGWRTAVVGAERVTPEALRSFSELLGDFGFRPESFCPAYGMAESTLAISGGAPQAVPTMVSVAAEKAEAGRALLPGEARPATVPPSKAGEALVVSCGKPLTGLEVAIVSEDGGELAEGTLGEIAVRGPSVSEGYHGEGPAVSTRFAGDRLLTGDAGFLHDGELFVLGRIADSLKIRGTYVYVEDLEIRVAAALGIPLSRCVVVTAAGVESDLAAVLVEAGEEELTAEQLIPALRPALGAGIEVNVHRVARHSLVKTTSGKPRRRLIARMLAAGELDSELALTLPAVAPAPGVSETPASAVS